MNTVNRIPRGLAARLTELTAVGVCVLLLAGCSGTPDPPQATAEPTSTPPTSAEAPSPPPTEPPEPETPPAPPEPTTAVPQPPVVEAVTAEQLGATWRPDCPIIPGQLRRIELDHLGFDARTHRGAIVVHEELVEATIAAFDRLYQLGFPIERMRTVENYPGADDELSMQDNNTSAFNCRDIPGSGQWSYHAYGRAIDINPRLNPYIDRTGAFQPDNAGVFVDRDRIDPGLLKDGDAAVRAFTDHGWQWGGYWRTPKDYQHFEWP